MKINSLKFGMASAVAAAILWVICSLLIWMIPGGMMNLTTNMVHLDVAKSGWALSPMGVVWGLVAWSMFAGIFAWLLATIYNLLTKS